MWLMFGPNWTKFLASRFGFQQIIWIEREHKKEKEEKLLQVKL